ncbi:hypothetical protein [Streptomyces sp. enrichment culture]|uniref:hypothetical protein n=1 Tax=Streptomyces sp. enrichment culture TaxID=1795815 RepID=UPI003F57A1E5
MPEDAQQRHHGHEQSQHTTKPGVRPPSYCSLHRHSCVLFADTPNLGHSFRAVVAQVGEEVVSTLQILITVAFAVVLPSGSRLRTR